MALGLKGGFALARSGLTHDVASTLACAVLLAVAIPLNLLVGIPVCTSVAHTVLGGV